VHSVAISLDTNQDGHGGGVLVSTVGKTALVGGASGTQLNVAVTRGRRKIVLSAVPDAGSAAALLQENDVLSLNGAFYQIAGHGSDNKFSGYDAYLQDKHEDELNEVQAEVQRITVASSVGWDATTGINVTFLGTYIGSYRLTSTHCGAPYDANTMKNCDGTTTFPGIGEPGAESTCCCLVGNLETECVSVGSCAAHLKLQVESILQVAGTNGGLYDTAGFDSVVQVDESCGTSANPTIAFDISISSARSGGQAQTYGGRAIGTLPLIEVAGCTVARIHTGDGDILPKEIQIVRIYGSTKSSSLGGFFQLAMENDAGTGTDTTGDIHVRAPAMRSKRTRHPDNSMVREIGLSCACWWYSWCNLAY
jgi:hypothetical protein